MAFFEIQETPSVYVNTDYIERFNFTIDSEGSGNLTIHFVSGENISFTGAQGPAAHELLMEVLAEESSEE
jgi:hypothetical protein